MSYITYLFTSEFKPFPYTNSRWAVTKGFQALSQTYRTTTKDSNNKNLTFVNSWRIPGWG
jgi:hypothetical protein